MADSGEVGRFVTLEGGEGAGKSTQISLLADRLRKLGIDVLVTREPGGTPGAEAIRELLVTGAGDRWDPLTEALLHFAARRDHLVRAIWPALQQGRWVLCDRFADSTRAYQGAAQGLDPAAVEDLYRLSVGNFAPDLTFVLDLPVEEGLGRAHDRDGHAGRYEAMDREFHEKLRAAFLEIASREPGRCLVIDAARPSDTIAADIFDIVRERLLS